MFWKLILWYMAVTGEYISTYKNIYHCVKSVQIRSFFRSLFSRMRTEYGELLIHQIIHKYRELYKRHDLHRITSCMISRTKIVFGENYFLHFTKMIFSIIL